MAEKKEIKDDIKEPEKQIDPKIEEKVEKKLDSAEKKIEKVTGERENIVNYVPKPRTDDPDFDFKEWAKILDTKLDQLLSHHKPKSDESGGQKHPDDKPKEEPKKSFWDRELI